MVDLMAVSQSHDDSDGVDDLSKTSLHIGESEVIGMDWSRLTSTALLL